MPDAQLEAEIAAAEVVIVGAGIGGSALAVVLAEAGLPVLLLEKTRRHKDVVRGEWMAPWGVLEANELGLTSLYQQHGAHRPQRHVTYNEFMSRQQAEAHSLPLDSLPETPLCLGHPDTCNLLNERARALGVPLLRGIQQLRISAGAPPQISFLHEDQVYDLQPRLVVGADGRNGVVAGQIGCTTSHDPEHHLFSGMLVADAPDWPEDLQVIATEGDVNVLAFPQGHGKVRVYLGWPSDDRTRLLGPRGAQNFLQAWQLECVPHAQAIVEATPVSPCIAYPNYDAWVDSPVREGVVLIGDAAGRNDPIIGQGLSIAHRDVRLVRDVLLANPQWHEAAFEPYVAERRERMQRLRTTARLTSLRESAFGEDGRALRQQIHERLDRQPDLSAPYSAAFLGPEVLPAEVFSDTFTREIVGQPIWNTLP